MYQSDSIRIKIAQIQKLSKKEKKKNEVLNENFCNMSRSQNKLVANLFGTGCIFFLLNSGDKVLKYFPEFVPDDRELILLHKLRR